MMPTSPQSGAPQVDWDVQVERANTTQCTYWITVKNLTTSTVNFEGRYAVLS
jgi:glycyl-tRNA synthetase alpha subunit